MLAESAQKFNLISLMAIIYGFIFDQEFTIALISGRNFRKK
jgi:hypothetical protein